MELITIIIYLILFIIVLFISREIVLWFWKINENIKLHQETNRLLRKIVDKFESYDKVATEENSFRCL